MALLLSRIPAPASAGAFFWAMSGVQLSCQHKTGKLAVFLQFAAINTPPPHRGSQKTLFMGREGVEAWKIGTRLGGCFWSEDLLSV